MAKQTIGLGAAANDNTGDTLRIGGDKINDNFNEIYSTIGNGSTLLLSTGNAAIGQVLKYNGTNFIPGDFGALTTALDVNGNNITSSSSGNVVISPNGSGSVNIVAGGTTSVFNGSTGSVDFPANISYRNEYAALGNAPVAATYPGYFFTVDGDDNPYVNINITAGGVGDTRAAILTQYSGINSLSDVDTTTSAPLNDQVLKWNSTTSKWVPADDQSGLTNLNLFTTISADTGSTTADSSTDSIAIEGGSNISTNIVGDVLTIDFTGTITSTFAGLTDTDTTGLIQGNSIFYNGTSWVRSASPIVWWELGANGSSDFTFSGPGFPNTQNDPTIYVYRGFTYAFDNTANGANHPFRIQETTGLTGNPYTAGQSGNGTSVLYWTVPMDAPTTLYYQCTIHAAMNGTIIVVS
ncbi:baseplate wedge tail fiber connector [Synechococcus phage S-RIM8]|uniref:Baseplate wedge tail fiber connector n=1 Tax=Synechococcus phage S-RIM8 TaxID=756278 RepID=A0A1D7S9U6_9CAUD|nr:baseplate wedge tail fiber connector [Synechococcus phage S-RIM8]